MGLPKDSLAQPHMKLLCKVPVLFSIFMLFPLPPTVDQTASSPPTRTASNGEVASGFTSGSLGNSPGLSLLCAVRKDLCGQFLFRLLACSKTPPCSRHLWPGWGPALLAAVTLQSSSREGCRSAGPHPGHLPAAF